MILSSWLRALSTQVFGTSNTGTVKLFGIPVGEKKSKSTSKMSKYTSRSASDVPPASPREPLNMVQISAFLTKALFIYNYQKDLKVLKGSKVCLGL